MPTDAVQRCGAGKVTGHGSQSVEKAPGEHRREAKPCPTGQEILKTVKIWVHSESRLLGGALDKVLLHVYVLT